MAENQVRALRTTGGIAQDTGLLGLTPSQTVGPYLAIGLDWGRQGWMVVPAGTPGAFWIRGHVLDGEGVPVPDALVETWQADPQGRFASTEEIPGSAPSELAGFRGLGRSTTDRPGNLFHVHTVRPAALPATEDPTGPVAAPHLNVSVFARGLLDRVVTRMYFPDEPLNEHDPVLTSIAASRRSSMIAQPDGPDGFRFDIRLQGPDETGFLLV